MSLRKLLGLITLGPVVILGGCKTSIDYVPWAPGAQVQSNSLKFSLQDSTITLQAPSASTPQGGAAVGAAPANAAPKPACPDDVTAASWATTWWECFNQVKAQAAPAAPDLSPTAAPNSALPLVWVAKSADSQNLWLTTTAISGTAISGQDGLYSVVTIKFTSNVGAVITAAGTGAAAGFGIGGPYGAAAGFVLGAISAVNPAAVAPGETPPPPTFQNFVCAADAANLNLSTLQTKPAITFPLTIAAADARPLSPQSELTAATQPLGPATNSDCWHVLPNAASLAAPRPLGAGAGAPRTAATGDGWLYRLVATDSDPTQPPLGATAANDFFYGGGSGQEFPYSSCRKTTMQVTWWNELQNAVANKQAPRVVTFSTVVADPAYVDIAYVKKGGAINFKPDCGANVTMDADTSSSAILNAAVTQAEGIYKAEQTWAGTSTTAAPKPAAATKN